MKLGFIVPVRSLRQYASMSNYHLVLAHMVEGSKEYREFYLERSRMGDFVTLDNSSYELGDGLYTPQKLIDIAGEVEANEIMAPEKFRDGPATYKLVEQFAADVEKYAPPGIGVFATIHGKTVEEALECFRRCYELKRVGTYGISCRLDFTGKRGRVKKTINATLNRTFSRMYLLDRIRDIAGSEYAPGKIYDKYLLRNSIHLLGLNSPFELTHYRNWDLVRSNDSSAAYIAGLSQRRKLMSLTYTKSKRKLDFYDNKILTYSQHLRISNNILMMKELAGDDYKSEVSIGKRVGDKPGETDRS